ncbi:MAG: hypothetical protein ACD_3C00198G0014 [uncultured bacterium (gcode 4)]|uniref:DNA 3'-5' helicase n=1 Tax=uncultured bacterium (gcode 4) TaxID=1234023 RepID=K2GVY6_9BACT|nr:MAG: hypothetical protein ACD_3C00198G0014 [uncultured bacterium (gcode 4)]
MNGQNNNRFETEYGRLNKEQKQAVDTVYWPAMVIAWPGTGKTQIISLRTANIIKETWADAGNILITTFTEAWVIAIKKRLFDFIGSDSYKVNVCTIHSFCNDIIQMFPEKFLEYRAFRTLDDIEQIELFENIIDEWKFEALSSEYDKYFYLRTIKDKIWKLKQEWITPARFEEIIISLKLEYSDILDSIDQKLKKYANEKERQEKHIKKLEELNIIYSKYLSVCNRLWVYDFADMIDFVLRKMEEDENLRLFYAEKYQFIMVDEYQDTNNAQNSIVDSILSASDEKNILVVWDDDQSIYRFQWANLENMLYFSQKYKNTQFIVLQENYRSTQNILNLATKSIKHNTSRISNYIEWLEKRLNSNTDLNYSPEFYSLPSEIEEKTLIINKIREHEKSWTSQEEIAIIVRTNKEVEDYTWLLQANWYEVQSRLNSNILDSAFVRMLLEVMEIIKDPYSSEVKVADLLRSSIWDIPKADILRLLKKLSSVNYIKKDKLKLFDFIINKDEMNSLFLKEEEKLQWNLFEMNMSSWQAKATLDWFQDFVDSILDCQMMQRSNFYAFSKYVMDRLDFVAYVEKTGNWSDIQDIYTLLEIIKSWVQSNHDFTLENFLKKISYYQKYSLILPRQILGWSKWWVNVMTAHQSKWLEYDVVFVPWLTHGNWWARRVIEHLKLPYWVIGSSITESLSWAEWDEEERRLFFVAITRARKHLTLSFPIWSWNKPKLQSQFLQELQENSLVINDLDIKDVIINELKWKVNLKQIQKEEEHYILEFLKNYKLSPSDLNKFIENPKLFLRDTIFKYPFEDNEFTIFWKVYHKTLEYFYLDFKNNKAASDLKFMHNKFSWLLRQEILTPEEFSRLEKKWLEWLAWWHDMNVENLKIPVELECDFRPRWITLDWIPLTWKIDKIEELFENEVRLVDYKTGRAKSTNEIKWNTANSDGKYFRQLIFYKIMFDLDNSLSSKYNASSLAIEFVEGKDGRYPFVNIEWTQEDVERVKDEIRDAWKKINDLEFWRGIIS